VNVGVLRRCQFGYEIGKSGTPHLQGFVHLKNAKSWSALGKFLFGSNRAHFEKAKGTDFENWVYTGKDANLCFQYGDEPREEGELSDWEKILEMLKLGASNLEIIERFPAQGLRCQTALEKYRLEFDREHQAWRDVTTTYISGITGVGKTRLVMEKYGYNNVHRVTNAKNPWDTYRGQDVVIFEEFRNNQKIEDMLNWLDGYPIELPARYADKLAKFTKVYILSNWNFENQYEGIRDRHQGTYAAWERRITEVVEMKPLPQEEE
jgi:hypothetical protein